MLESFLISLVGIVDTIMVGSLGSYAIAAVGLTTQPKFVGLAIFISLNVAVSAIIAHRRGEGDREQANKVLMQAIIITIALAIVVSTLCVIFANPIIAFSGSAADTHESAVTYFRIIMGGMIFNVLSLVINAAQRGAGNTKVAMRTNMVSNIINLILNYLLIEGRFGFPALGIKGSAIATVIGSIFACIMSINSISKSDQFLSLKDISAIRFDKKTLASIGNIGSSTLAEQVFLRIGFLTYSIIVAKLGTDAFAAHQIGMNVMSLSFSFGDGLSVAAIALVGCSLGEKREDMAKIYGGVCQRIGLTISLGLAIIYFSLGKQIFMLFTKEVMVVDYAVMIMFVITFIVVFQISQVIYSGCLRGAGDTKFTAFVSLISVAIIRPFSGWLLCYPLGLGLVGAWIGILVDQIVRFSLTALRFRTGKWTKFKV
jgi:putative MATE family efflux protein